MMNEYRFHLEKYRLGNRYTCPNCERKRCFTRYIDDEGKVSFPDLGATDKWKSKIPLLQSVCKRVVISNILEDNATDEQKTNGLDIADFLLMAETPQMALQRLIKQHPPLQHLIDSLGLVLVEEP